MISKSSDEIRILNVVFFMLFLRSEKWVRASARKIVFVGAGAVPHVQTNAMLAVVRADDESLVPP